jgi:molybdopterin converting factor subunit 1
MMSMNVNILTFGIAKEILGGAAVGIELDEGVTAEKLKSDLEEQYPRLKELTSFAIAVNGEYASADTMINAGDEVAIIPPVSGG